MKRLFVPVLLFFCLLLSACGAKAAENQYKSFSQALSAREDLSFTARLRAEYEDRSVEFTLGYTQEADGCTVTVLEPALIAGIQAHLSPEGASLEFDGISVDTGALDAYGLTPLSALPVLAETLKSGHLESVWEEDGLLFLQLIYSDGLYAVAGFDQESMTPVRAELVSDGVVKVVCEIENWR